MRKRSYIILVLAIALILYASFVPIMENSYEIEEGSGTFLGSLLKYLCLVISFMLGFPMLRYWSFVGGDWLKQYLGDNAVMFLFAAIDAILWGIVIASVVCAILKLRKRYKERICHCEQTKKV